jgi:Flp pilus assembly protein TadD
MSKNMTKRTNKIITLSALALLLTACEAHNHGLNSQQERAMTPMSMERVADASLQSGDAKSAASIYRKILLEEPRNAQVKVKLGNSLIALNAPRQALSYYRSATVDAPDYVQAHHGAGRAHLMLDQPDLALPFLQKALLLEPNPQNYAGLGVAYDLLSQYDKAQATYRSGLRAYPTNLELRNNLGLSLLLNGDPESAIAILQSVAYAPESNIQHRSNLAMAYGLSGNMKAAKRVLEKDFNAKEVARNLKVYEDLRSDVNRSLREAIIMGDHKQKVVVFEDETTNFID